MGSQKWRILHSSIGLQPYDTNRWMSFTKT